jgi:hypothetical protein
VPQCADQQAGYHVGLPVGDARPFKRKKFGRLDVPGKKNSMNHGEHQDHQEHKGCKCIIGALGGLGELRDSFC